MAKKPPKGFRFFVREFLNKPGVHSTAFVYATVRDIDITDEVRKRAKNDEFWFDTELQIADCDRTIRLDFSSRHDLPKLDALIGALTDFREAFVDLLKDVEVL